MSVIGSASSEARLETHDPASYEVEFDGILYVLIDTPGFDDSNRSNKEILNNISSYLSAQHKSGQLLSGIIYLHPISRNRVQGSTMTQMRVFKELCGTESYQNVVLGTTFWETVDMADAKTREKQLFSTPGFLGDMIDFGVKTVRISKDREVCIKLVKYFAEKDPVPLRIQTDVAAAAGGVDASRAAAALSAELEQLRLEQEKELKEQCRQARKQAREQARKQKLEEQKKRQEAARRRQQRREERQRLELEAEARLEAERERARVAIEKEAQEKERKRLKAVRQSEITRQIEEDEKREAKALRQAQLTAERRERERKEEQRRQEILREEMEKEAVRLEKIRQQEYEEGVRRERERREREWEAEEKARQLRTHSRIPMYPHGGWVRSFSSNVAFVANLFQYSSWRYCGQPKGSGYCRRKCEEHWSK